MRLKADAIERMCSTRLIKWIMTFSFIVLLLSAINQYDKLSDKIIWEDESMTWQAVKNLLETGIPRLGPLKNSKYWVDGGSYRLYTGYLAEEILRVPVQLIGKIMHDSTFQIYTPLLYTMILTGIFLYYEKIRSKEIMVHITLSNIILALSPFLMSSYHYIRYYWFVIAATYACLIYIGLVVSEKHDIKKSIISVLVSLIPFLFHPVGMILFPTVLFHEIFYIFRNNELEKKAKKKIIVIFFLFIVFGSIVAIRTIIKNNLGIDKLNFIYSISYLTSIFAPSAGNMKYIRIIFGMSMMLYGLFKKDNDYSSTILKLSSIYILLMSVLMPLLGTKILSERYYICSHMIFILMISSFIIIVLRNIFLWKRWQGLVVVTCGVLLALYIPTFNINPGYGLSEAHYSDLDKIIGIDTSDRNVYVVSGDMSIIDYLPEKMKYVRFRTENRVEKYEIADNGRYIQDGWCDFIGSWKTWDAYMNTVNDDDIIAFFGIKRYSGDDDFNEFLQSMNAFDSPCIHTKLEYLNLQENFR